MSELVVINVKDLEQIVTRAVETALNSTDRTHNEVDSYFISAKEAARVLGYKSVRSLKQFHNATPGIKPVRRRLPDGTSGRTLFYKREEVEKLKELLFK